MVETRKKIDLLIREIKPDTHNGRYLRENLRRIKSFIDGILDGTIPVGVSVESESTVSPDVFNKYELHYVGFDGQVAFTLNELPASSDKVAMKINGVDMTNGVHFTVVGKDVTFDPVASQFDLEVSNEFGVPDKIIFQYMV